MKVDDDESMSECKMKDNSETIVNNSMHEAIQTIFHHMKVDEDESTSERKIIDNSESAVMNRNKRFECPVCHRMFANPFKLYRHSLTHDPSLNCKTCGEFFKNKSNLKKHRREAHITDAKCDQCGKVFNTEDSFRKHLETHNPDPEA